MGETQPQNLFPQVRHNLRGKCNQILLLLSPTDLEERAHIQGFLIWELLSLLGLALWVWGGANLYSRLPGLGVSQGPAHLVPSLCWRANGETQAKNHARSLGDDADHVEGGGGLVWGTEEKWESVSGPTLRVSEFRSK